MIGAIKAYDECVEWDNFNNCNDWLNQVIHINQMIVFNDNQCTLKTSHWNRLNENSIKFININVFMKNEFKEFVMTSKIHFLLIDDIKRIMHTNKPIE